MALQESAEPSLREAVAAAAARPELRRAVDDLYADVSREIDRRRPRCDLSGRCCRFEEYGHRLFVTTIELARFLLERDATALKPDSIGAGCPFQIGRLCGVHAIRPFGCRMFFCDPSAAEWQNALYERFHARLKRLHEELLVPYFYVEWRQALRMLGGADQKLTPTPRM